MAGPTSAGRPCEAPHAPPGPSTGPCRRKAFVCREWGSNRHCNLCVPADVALVRLGPLPPLATGPCTAEQPDPQQQQQRHAAGSPGEEQMDEQPSSPPSSSDGGCRLQGSGLTRQDTGFRRRPVVSPALQCPALTLACMCPCAGSLLSGPPIPHPHPPNYPCRRPAGGGPDARPAHRDALVPGCAHPASTCACGGSMPWWREPPMQRRQLTPPPPPAQWPAHRGTLSHHHATPNPHTCTHPTPPLQPHPPSRAPRRAGHRQRQRSAAWCLSSTPSAPPPSGAGPGARRRLAAPRPAPLLGTTQAACRPAGARGLSAEVECLTPHTHVPLQGGAAGRAVCDAEAGRAGGGGHAAASLG